ncbi:MAG: NfeD family protein [Pseudomonadales bacterium]|nr:NfeD family protein [Pseudomonadales bacterium]
MVLLTLLYSISQVMVIVGLLLILLELFIGIEAGFDLVLIGSILIISGFAGIAFDSYLVSTILAIILSFLYIVFGRRFVKQKVVSSTHSTNVDKLIGARAVVVQDITKNNPGRVKLEDEEWRATSAKTVSVGEVVVVESISGVTLGVVQKEK